MASVHEGHRKRVKNKLLKHGIDCFEAHEALELLLFYSIPQGDVNPLAHRLIDTFGSLDRVFEADPADLMKVKGVGEHSAVLIKLVMGLIKEYGRQKAEGRPCLNSPNDAVDYAVSMFTGETVEKCYLMSFDSKLRLISCDLVSQGSGHGTAIVIKQVAEIASRHRASSVIMIHNHPDGLLIPSVADNDATKKVYRALGAIGIELVDHIIVSEGKALSFAQAGVMALIKDDMR